MSYLQTFDRQEIRIVDVPSINGVIYGAYFRECTITGPAILALLSDNELTYGQFQGDLDAVFWEIPESRPAVIGAIGLRGCRLERCRFVAIGLAGPPNVKRQFLPPGASGAAQEQGSSAQSAAAASGAPINVIYVNQMTHSQIQQSTAKSVQYVQPISELSRHNIEELADQLSALLPQLELNEEDAQEAEAELAAVKAQARSSRPKRSAIKAGFATVETILAKSSQVATTTVGLAEALDKLHKILPGL